MSKRATKVKTEKIVAPGMRGGEDFLQSLARTAGERGIYESARRGMAATRSGKGVIEEMVAEGYAGAPLPAPDAITWFLHQYVVSLWVYSAIRQIATNLASVPLMAQTIVGGKWENQPDSELQQLIDEPLTPLSTGEVIEMASTFLEAAGSEVIVAERKHGDPMRPTGPIVGFVPLRPSLVTIEPGGQYIKMFNYMLQGGGIDIDPGNAQLLRYIHPENDYWGLSPMSPLVKTVGVDAGIEDYNLNLLKNGATPELVLRTEQVLQRANARRTKLEFEQRYTRTRKNGGVVVLDRGLDLKPIGLPPKDMQYVDAAKMSETRILSAYGVPPIMVMDLSEASVLANADQQVKLFFKFTLRQKGEKLESALTRLIRSDPRFGPKWRLRFDFDQVAALRDADKEREDARKNYQAGLTTRDEARAAMQMPPAAEGGDEFRQSGPDPAALQDMQAAEQGKGLRRRGRPQFTPEYKALARTAFRRQFDAAFKGLRSSMRGFFADQRDRVLHRFEGLRAELGPNMGIQQVAAGFSAKAIADATMVARLFDVAEEQAKFLDEVGPVFLVGMVDAANEKMAQLVPSTRLALSQSHVGIRSFYERWGATQVVDVQEKTRDAIRGALQYGFDNGLSTHEIEQQLVNVFKDLTPGGEGDPDTASDFPQYRLERIARTETQTMLNTGSFEGVKELAAHGANIRKSWLSARDEIVRDSHQQLDNETSSSPIPITEQFSNGLMHPGDSSGPAGEIVNCRCSMIEVVLDEGN